MTYKKSLTLFTIPKAHDNLTIQTLNGIFETAQGSKLRKGAIVSARFKQLYVVKYTVQLP